MAVALVSMRRLHPLRGPALGKRPLPATAIVFSAGFHVLLAVAVILGARTWTANQPKTYVVNLVPAVAAVGTPQGRTTATPPALPPEPQQKPADLPTRETARPSPAPELPARSSIPSRPEMPARTREASVRPLPDRTPALPRAGDKELPTVASAAPPKREPATAPAPSPAPATPAAPPRQEAAAPPAPPLGAPTGSRQGAGAVTLNVTDFPYAWYISAVVRKVTDRWTDRALQGRQPIAVVEIARTGRVNSVSIDKTSGNPYYDQAALRAIADASPFPPLPDDFEGSVLRVHMRFNFDADRG